MARLREMYEHRLSYRHVTISSRAHLHSSAVLDSALHQRDFDGKTSFAFLSLSGAIT